MPNVRILNWNIQQLGPTKVGVPGMLSALGRVIAGTNADVAIITEISAGTAVGTIVGLAAAANAEAGGGALYTARLLSHSTGGECYGVIIRDINVVRPVVVSTGPIGDDAAPLGNLEENSFATWPNTFAAAGAIAPPYPLPPPRLPLIDVFASTPPVGRKRSRFAGRTLTNGGYSLGRGFRMPCLVMVAVNSPALATYLIPIMVCHLGAVRGGSNALARGQIAQYKDTDIAQRFNAGGYIDLDGAAVQIQELVITGDFNVDFLRNAAVGTKLQTGNRAALNHLTPTQAGGSSAGPAALPGVPGGVPMVPFVAPPAGWPPGPVTTDNPDLALRTAITNRGTMLRFPQAPGVAAVPPYDGACFDNFFYGGTQLAGGTVQAAPGVPAETGVIPSVPTAVVRVPAAVGPNVGPLWTHYNGLPLLPVGTPPLKRQWAMWAPNLNPEAMAALTGEDRLVGGRFISDHLPTYIQANLP